MLLIYGAYGYTGRLITRAAASRGPTERISSSIWME